MPAETPPPTPLDLLRLALEDTVEELRGSGPPAKGRPSLERPPRAALGDYSTNAAMLLAGGLGEPPRAVAERVVAGLARRLGARLERTEIAGPGFVNLFLADAWFHEGVERLLAAGDALGAGGARAAGRAESVLVEFVSANPTGPLTAASGRHAAYGDALARILEWAGHRVEREYYFNDAGSQVRRLAESVQARALGRPVGEEGYRGEYVAELARAIPDAATAPLDALARAAVAQMTARIRATLDAYRVTFDTWFTEGSLHAGDPTPVARAQAVLAERGATYRADGALWLRTSDFGDDKDRVLERSSGEPTYFASDVAYLEHKLERGFDRLVYVLGADHHGYIGRLRAAATALGAAPERLDVPILQLVSLVEGGERASMSKRRGDFVTLDELVAEIGVDAARYLMLSRSHDSPVDLDLDLARSSSAENPVYYVQYAHARIASMLSRLPAERLEPALAGAGEAAPAALEPAERELVLRLLAFGPEVVEAAERRAPHRIAAYALETAQAFTAFYRDCKVVGVAPAERERSRVALSVAAQRVLARSLALLGVAAPDAM